MNHHTLKEMACALLGEPELSKTWDECGDEAGDRLAHHFLSAAAQFQSHPLA